MDYDELARLRERDPGWKLLRADTAPMAITFLHRVFVERNLRTVPLSRLTELLDDELYALNERLGERKLPKAPKVYIDDWAHADRGWLRESHETAPGMEMADTCFACAEIYEDQLIPKIGDVQRADSSLATEDGSEGYADPKVKARI